MPIISSLKKLWDNLNFDPYKKATMERFGHDYKITLAGGRGVYVGDCMVWHAYPCGKRAANESALSDVWQREKWKMEAAKREATAKPGSEN